MNDSRNIVITGAAGFVGSALARRLVKGKDRIHLLIRKGSNQWRLKDIIGKARIHYADLNDFVEIRRAVARIKPRVIFHLAAHSDYLDESAQTLKTDILATLNLLEVCREIGFEAFINTGSHSEYGIKNTPMKESDLPEPNSYYAVAKTAQTLLCQHLGRDEKLPITTLRLCAAYGPYEMPRLIPTLIKNCLQGKDLDLSRPNLAKDYIFIDDVVGAYLKAARLKKFNGETFNIGSGQQTSMRQLVSLIVRLTGAKVRQNWGVYPARKFDTNVWLVDVGRAEKVLQWQPRHDLEQGLRKTIVWFRKNLDYYG